MTYREEAILGGGDFDHVPAVKAEIETPAVTVVPPFAPETKLLHDLLSEGTWGALLDRIQPKLPPVADGEA